MRKQTFLLANIAKLDFLLQSLLRTSFSITQSGQGFPSGLLEIPATSLISLQLLKHTPLNDSTRSCFPSGGAVLLMVVVVVCVCGGVSIFV